MDPKDLEREDRAEHPADEADEQLSDRGAERREFLTRAAETTFVAVPAVAVLLAAGSKPAWAEYPTTPPPTPPGPTTPRAPPVTR